jgi:signal peptidase II
MSFLSAAAGRRGYYALALAVTVVDQASKIAADAYLRGRAPVRVIPGFFSLWYSRNRGGLFGYFAAWEDPWRTVLLTVFPLIAIAALAAFLAKVDEPDRRTLFGLATILGGAMGNLIDRAVRGEVVDFLDAYVSQPRAAEWLADRFGTAHWPTFNLADSAIVLGACLLLIDLFRPGGGSRPAAEAKEREAPGEPPSTEHRQG